jgi:dihydropyrimidinase
MHLVHLSCERALDAARNPDTVGLPLTIETRPLYLYFTDAALLGADGPLYVGQPPLRPSSDLQAMWRGLADGRITFLATDHAPWTREQKMAPELDVERLRPGVSDLRFMLPVLYSEGVRKGRISEERFVEVVSTGAARTFGLYPERGVVREGSLADLVVFDPELERTASADDDPSRSDYTPFEGWTVTGWPVITIRRGEVVYEDGRVTGQPGSGRPAERRPRGA